MARPVPTDRLSDVVSDDYIDENTSAGGGNNQVTGGGNSDPTDQPARGNDPTSGGGRGSGGSDPAPDPDPDPTPDPAPDPTPTNNDPTPDPDPDPDPTNQPARGNDPSSGGGRGSGGGGDVNESDPTPTHNDPTNGGNSGGDSNNDPAGGTSGGTQDMTDTDPLDRPAPDYRRYGDGEVPEGFNFTINPDNPAIPDDIPIGEYQAGEGGFSVGGSNETQQTNESGDNPVTRFIPVPMQSGGGDSSLGIMAVAFALILGLAYILGEFLGGGS